MHIYLIFSALLSLLKKRTKPSKHNQEKEKEISDTHKAEAQHIYIYMEEKKSMCKEGRKKIAVGIGGGGIGGVVLLGGALAAATLIAADFTMKRSWGRRPSNKDQQLIPTTDMCKKLKINEDEGREGLRSLLQTSSPSLHPNPCCRSDGKSEMDVTQIVSLELVSTQSLLSEEKPVLMLEINGEKETLLCGDEEILPSNYSKSGNIPAIKVKKEDEACETIHAEQMEEDPTMQSVEEEDSEEDVDDIVGYAVKICIERLEINFQNPREKIVDTPSVEANEVKKDEEVCETVCAERVKEDPPKQSVEDDVDDDEGGIVVEKGKESLEGMGDSLIESIVKPVWPTESIERLEINFQNSGEKIDDTPYVEAIEVKKEDEVLETACPEQVEEDPPMQSVEDDDEGGIVVENGKESLEGMGDSLIESIMKPVWPTESIERLEINFQNSGEKIDGAPSVEAIEVKKEDEVLETACPEQVEEDPPLQSIKDVDDDEGEIVAEKVKESLEGMGDSWIESIVKPVRPTESIERLEINFQNSGEKIDGAPSVEAIEVKKEDEVLETACPEQVEEDPPLQSIKDVVDDDEGEIVAEKVKESLEGMGDSLIESIVKPVRRTESIERLEINFQNSGQKIDDAPSVEAIEVKKEDEVLETAYPEQVEEHPPMQSVEDDAVDDEGEIVAEKGKESLEGMGDSLTESIRKLVWPTEPIERLKVNFQNSGEKIEDVSSAEDIDLKKEDEAYKTIHGEQMEEDPSMKSIEVEDEEDDDKGGYAVEKGQENSEDPPLQSIQEEEEGDYVIEKGEESSEGTEDSSMEFNTELVWPTESIERLSLEFKEMKFNFQNSEKKIEEEDIRVKKEDDSSNNSRDNGNTYDLGNNNKEIARKSATNSNKIRETSELVKVNEQPPNSAKGRIWIWSVFVLVILLLLLSLTHHEAMSRYLLNDDSFIIP